MERTQWNQIARYLELPKRTRDGKEISHFPVLDLDGMKSSEDHHRQTLAAGYEAALNLARDMGQKKDELENSKRYTKKGAAEELADHYERKVKPGLDSLKGKLVPALREVAEQRTRDAMAADIPTAQSPFEVGLAMASLQWAREAGAEKVLNASPEIQRAIAMSPPELSGLNPHTHAMVKNTYFQEHAGVATRDAQAFTEELDALEETLAITEVLTDQAAGKTPPPSGRFGTRSSESEGGKDSTPAN